MTAEIVVDDPLKDLTKRERAAYGLSISRKEPFLSPILADQLYSLFEAGKTCEEIQALNKGISLGTIVRGRIDFKWDDKRQEHFQGLLDRAKSQAQQLTLESLSFLGDLLNAFHRYDREKFQKYIQTGDASELSGSLIVGVGSFKTYQAVVELLMKMTGQDNKPQTQTIQGTVEHHVTVGPAQDQPLTPAQAANLLLGPK